MKTLPVILIIVILAAIVWYIFYTHEPARPLAITTTRTDTMVIVKDSIIKVNSTTFDTIPSGFYQGMLPCKNCEGIQRTIMFSDDDHFKMEELNWGKGTLAKRTEGTWEKENGKFLFTVNDKVVSKYRLSKDSLINIENGGAVIPDSLSKQYALFKKNTAPENSTWKKKQSEGIDIIGNGSDPYWSVEIDNEKFILFKPAASARPVIVPIEKPVITKDSTVYTIVTEANATLKISLSSRFCNDGVSDHLYEYKMTVWYKGQTYKGCGVILHKSGQD
jgi:uncharacterized membrane protein